jgi:FtsZ-interacting cell division protein ZipA
MDYFGPREVLIVVGVLVILAIILDGARRIKRNRYENLQMSSQASFPRAEPGLLVFVTRAIFSK